MPKACHKSGYSQNSSYFADQRTEHGRKMFGQSNVTPTMLMTYKSLSLDELRE
jgi:hypothetical protein